MRYPLKEKCLQQQLCFGKKVPVRQLLKMTLLA